MVGGNSVTKYTRSCNVRLPNISLNIEEIPKLANKIFERPNFNFRLKRVTFKVISNTLNLNFACVEFRAIIT